MDKKIFIKYFTIFVVLFSISFTIGHKIMNLRLDNKNYEKMQINDTNESNKEINILKQASAISPNTEIEKRTNYRKCDHLVVEIEPAWEEIINKNRQEFETYLNTNYSKYKLISFSNDKIILWNEKDHLCQNHYVIGEKDGYIAVFTVDDKGSLVLDNLFDDNLIDSLMELDRDKIRKGIVVDSEDELSNVLENFIS